MENDQIIDVPELNSTEANCIRFVCDKCGAAEYTCDHSHDLDYSLQSEADFARDTRILHCVLAVGMIVVGFVIALVVWPHAYHF